MKSPKWKEKFESKSEGKVAPDFDSRFFWDESDWTQKNAHRHTDRQTETV